MSSLTVIAVVAGLVVGVVLGALGGGGAILAVPVLVFALHESPQSATAGSLVIVGVSSLVAATSHARRGRVRWAQGLLFGAIGMLGAIVGSRLSLDVQGRTLLLAFSVLLLFVALLMWRRASAGARAAAAGEIHSLDIVTFRPTFHVNIPRVVRVLVAASAVGLLTGFFGVGGGFAAVPALVLALDFPMPVAVGTSMLVIALNSATALSTRLLSGASPTWEVVIPFTIAAIGGSLVGARVSGRIPPARLARVFALMLLCVAVYTAVGAGISH